MKHLKQFFLSHLPSSSSLPVFGFAFTLLSLLTAVHAPPATAQDLNDVLSGFDTEEVGQKTNQETDQETEQEASPEGGQLDDLMSGFADDADSAEEEPSQGEQDVVDSETDPNDSAVIPEWLQLSGRVGLAGSVNFAHNAPKTDTSDFRGLSMLRAKADLSAEMRWNGWQAKISGHSFYDGAYSIQGREKYTGQLLDSYEQEVEIDDLYLAGSLTPSLDFKTGRQVVVWGKSDNIRVTDILNPLDQRVPGMVDIKNLRLPVTMSKLDYYTGAWNLSGIILHEVRFSEYPVYNSDFYPGDGPPPPEDTPEFSFENQQYALALNGIFSGWDLSLYSAWVFEDRTHLVQNTETTFQREHSRVFMSGMTGNVALGNWLIKGEAAGFNGLEYTTLPDEEFLRVDLMAGIEYMGFSETVLSLEVVNRHLVNFDDRLLFGSEFVQEDSMQTMATLVRDFANDTIQLKILLSIFGGHGEDGSFERFQLDYDLTDSITLTGGVILYQAADQGAFSGVEDNDRAFFEFNYEF